MEYFSSFRTAMLQRATTKQAEIYTPKHEEEFYALINMIFRRTGNCVGDGKNCQSERGSPDPSHFYKLMNKASKKVNA